MSLDVVVPCTAQRMVVTCYSKGTNGAPGINEAVMLVTATVASQNQPTVNLAVSTAGSITKAFGLTLATGATGTTVPVVIWGCAKAVANATIAVPGTMLTLTTGTAGVRGRVSALSAGTAGIVDRQRYLGYNLTTTTAAGQDILVFVQGCIPTNS
jgi:hypothetical protein